MIVVLGLGNPGGEYADTRHNVGFMVVDRLAADCNVKFSRPSGGLVSTKAVIRSKDVLIAKPVTFMNKSGVGAKRALGEAGIDLRPDGDSGSEDDLKEVLDISDKVIVVVDDCDLPFGAMRLRKGGGSGGQKGIKSIVEWLGTDKFSRLRIGVGRPAKSSADGLADYVLSPFDKDEEESLEEELKRGVLAIERFVEEGIEAAMNTFN